MGLKRDNFWFSIVILILSVSFVAVSIARGFAHWEMAKEQYIVARIALDDGIELIKVSFKQEKKRNAFAEWLSQQSKTIAEFKKNLIKLDERIKSLENFSLWEKAVFPKREAEIAEYIATIYSLKRRESIVKLAGYLDDCQGAQKTNNKED